MSLHLLYLNTEADAAGVVPGVRAVAMTTPKCLNSQGQMLSIITLIL